MGHKKKNPQPPPPPRSNEDQDETKAITTTEAEAASVKLDCERALTALRRGNHTKALRLMKESSHRYQNSAILHRVQATICVKIASLIEDPNAKQRHLNNAIQSAKQAVFLSPNSLEYAHFYANLLYDAAPSNDTKTYEDVVHECERALSIQNPLDPAKDTLLHDDNNNNNPHKMMLLTPDARIAHLHQDLRSLIQKSNIASISTWMKNLGNGNGNNDKFQLIPMRRISEDPMEVGFLQNRRPNEIKKATKTPQERRKEIEVRVAAARLIQAQQQQQQQSSLPPPSSDPNNNDEEDRPPQSSSAAHRLIERRKYANIRKVVSSVDRMEHVRSYWNSMTQDDKKTLFQVPISQLTAHFTSSKDELAIDLLTEALSFAEANKTWKFWMCSCCKEKFTDTESHIQHVVREHMGNLSPKLQSLLPQEVDTDWALMIFNGTWKPIDVSAALPMIQELSKSRPANFIQGSSTEPRVVYPPKERCLRDTWASSPGGWKIQPLEEDSQLEDSSNFELIQYDSNHWEKAYSLSQTWPLSNDSEREKLLEKIRDNFHMILKHKYLASSHLNKVIQFAIDELQGIAPGSRILDLGLDQTPLCISFLGVPQLQKIIKFLQDIAQSCGLGRYSDKNNGTDSGTKGFEIKEKIVRIDDSLCLLLDDCLLQGEFTPSRYSEKGTSIDDGAAASSVLLSDQEYRGPPNSDLLLSWIFAGPSSGEQLASWTRLREEKTHRATEILHVLEKEFYLLQTLCDRKSEQFSCEEALQAVEGLCLEELKKREQATEFVSQSYESVLRKRQEELVERENDVMLRSSRFELDMISQILKEAQTLNVTQFGYEETLTGVTTRLCDLECGGDDDWKMHDFLHQADNCVEVAIQRQRDHFTVELSKIDARMMRNITGMQQLEHKLGPLSAHDFRAIMLPFVKSFIRSHLEELADKDATEKSEAAREAFLAELALDAKKSVNRGGDPSKHMQERSKEKKKNKDYRKSKDSKTTSGTEKFAVSQEIPEFPHSLAISNGPPNSGVVGMSSGDVSIQHEEDFRRKIELEEDERKLAETLEYQRRIENEAKELVEQHKRANGGLVDASRLSADSKSDAGDPDLQDSLRYFKPITHIGSLPINWTVINRQGSRVKFPSSNNQKIDVEQASKHAMLLSSETDNSSFSYHENPLKFYEDPSAGKMDLSEDKLVIPSAKGTAGTRKSSTYSGNERTKTANNHSHGKVAQGRPNRGKHEDEILLSSPWKGSEVKRLNDSTKLLGKMSRSEKEDNKVGNMQREGYAKEQDDALVQRTLCSGNGTLQSCQNLPVALRPIASPKKSPEPDDFGALTNEVTINNGREVFGTGLRNEVGEYNCFLNVIIQSLWHIKRFQDEFLRRSMSLHAHIGDPCVVCALYDIFSALSMAAADTPEEAVAPTCLRIALSNLYPDSNFFQEAQMNDASEVLAVIFDCLHRSFTSGSSGFTNNLEEINCIGTWDCAGTTCIAHTIFGMNIFERMNCYSCGVESRHLKYTSFFHNINASALRTMKSMCADSSFDELLNLVEMNHQLACDTEAGGCGKLNYIHHILSTPPHVFTTVLGWQNTCESANDIAETLAALTTELDIGVLYRGLDPGNMRRLVSVVCYYGQHYHCFAYSHEHDRWNMYDDINVKVIGSWKDVLSMCERGHLQPQVLFFENIN